MTRFVYLVEGEPHVGTIHDYIGAVKMAHYADLTVDTTVWQFEDGKPVATKAKLASTPYDEDDYSTLTVELTFTANDPEAASCRIDGRV